MLRRVRTRAHGNRASSSAHSQSSSRRGTASTPRSTDIPTRFHRQSVYYPEANAGYSRESESLGFGYFFDEHRTRVYTCFSHDIVVHETTRALLDGLRSGYWNPSSPDQAGFQEGFADVDDVDKTGVPWR